MSSFIYVCIILHNIKNVFRCLILCIKTCYKLWNRTLKRTLMRWKQYETEWTVLIKSKLDVCNTVCVSCSWITSSNPGFCQTDAKQNDGIISTIWKPIYVFLHNNLYKIRVTNVFVTYSLQWKQNRYSSHSLFKLNKLVFKNHIFLKYRTRLWCT